MRAQVLAVGLFVSMLLPMLLSVQAAQAQTGDLGLGGRKNYNVQSMNFDLWCQETQRHSVDRCDQRRLEDLEEFATYRNLIERYEQQYLMDQRRDAEAEQRANRSYGAPWDSYNDPRTR
jgi:hypothetical protein